VDVFTTVVGIVIAGIALFVGYRVGVKDGFRGGFQSGRSLERQLAVEQRRLIAARTVREQATLQPVFEQRSLPPVGIPAIQVAEDDEGWDWVSRVKPENDAAMGIEPYEERRR
jgi:hypothetical protein